MPLKWYQRLPVKLAVLFYFIFAFTVVAFALISVWAIRENTHRSVRENLTANANFWEACLQREAALGTPLNEERETLDSYARHFKIRLSLIDSSGLVVFDSSVPADHLKNLENHLHRPEIVQALAGNYGEDIRKSKSVDISQFYVAKHLGSGIHLKEIGRVAYIRVSYPLASLDEYYFTYMLVILLVSIGLLIGGIIIYKVLADRFAQPVLQMVQVARQITRGELQERIPVTTSDELGFLAKSINTMAEKLVDDIRKLKKLERVRSEFLANTSHELKTPIFTIQGFVETLLDGALDDQEVNRSFLMKIHKNSVHLNNLVSDLIEISKIETGELKMNFEQTDLNELITDVFESLEEKAAERDIRLVRDFRAFPAVVWADPVRMKQVFTNLVDNAIKYSDHGEITVSTEKIRENEIRFWVKDTGVGIPAEHLSRIFERFYRVDKHRSKDAGGTGLGLAIVKHILEAHNSTIRVTSQVGVGTMFSFDLICRPAQTPELEMEDGI